MQKYKTLVISKLLLSIAATAVFMGVVYLAPRQAAAQAPPPPTPPPDTSAQCRGASLTNDDYDDKGVFIGYDEYRDQCACKDSLSPEKCGIIAYIQLFINVLSGIVGVVVITMIAVGGVQYASSRDNPQQTAAAKARIGDAIMALVIFLFTFAFLQWLVPGGVFSRT